MLFVELLLVVVVVLCFVVDGFVVCCGPGWRFVGAVEFVHVVVSCLLLVTVTVVATMGRIAAFVQQKL